MTQAPPDTDTLDHLVIKASAGSGKTYRLSTRYLALLARGEPVQSVLATTFTRKAAGEILNRVLERLAEAATDETKARELAEATGEPIDRQRAQQLLADFCTKLHQAAVGTLDSFFNRIASCFCHELDLPADGRMLDEMDPALSQMRLDAIDAMLGEAAAKDGFQTLIDLMRRLHHDQNKRSVTQSLLEIVQSFYDLYRQLDRPELWQALRSPPGLISDEQLPACIEAVTELSEQIPTTKTGQPRQRWVSSYIEMRDNLLARRWDEMLGKGLIAKIAAGEETYDRAQIPPAWLDALRPIVEHIRAHKIDAVAKRTRATFELMARFDAQFQPLRRAGRVLTFTDLSQRLSRSLPAMDELYFRLDGQVQHLLLDEFQDTSLLQWDVLRPLAHEIASHNTRTLQERRRTLLCVGDIKQAIYGWRGGCSEIFDQLRRDLPLEDQAITQLNTSRRSSQAVLDVVNDVFGDLRSCEGLTEALLPHADGWAFEAHSAFSDKPGYVELCASPPAGEITEDDEPQYGEDEEETDDETAGLSQGDGSPHWRYVVKRVGELAQPGVEVGVLVRTNKAVALLVDLLRQHGVDASGEGGNPLTDDAAVTLALSALNMADHPGDSVAAFHVMHSPLGEHLGLEKLTPGHVQRIARQIRQDLLTRGYGQVLTDWARALSPHAPPRSAMRLAQLVTLADAYEPTFTLRPSRFVDFVRIKRVPSPTNAAVRVMTIHQSKGLEFDAVVLPELEPKLVRLSGAGPAYYLERDGDGGPLGEVTGVFCATDKATRALEPRLERAYDASIGQRFQDALCTLYVAMTRPRHALVMIAPPVRATKSGISKRGVADGSFAAVLRAQLKVDAEEELESQLPGEAQRLYQHGAGDWLAQVAPAAPARPSEPAQEAALVEVKLAQPEADQRRLRPRVTPSSLHESGRVSVAELLHPADPHGQRRGTLIHALFESVEWLDESRPDEAALREALRQAGGDQPPSEREADEVLAVFDQLLEHPNVQTALARPEAPHGVSLWRERPFAVRLGDRLVQGVFDRVVVYLDQNQQPRRAELIDFKTNKLKGPDSPARLQALYAPQMAAYKAALARMLRIDEQRVEARLLLTADPQLVVA